MHDNTWDDMSSEYDNCVEKNLNHVISDYINDEIKIIANLCKKIILSDKKFTIIDLGSGTDPIID